MGHWEFCFCGFCLRFFSFCTQKLYFFTFSCLLQFAVFAFFINLFPVFTKNTSSFSDLVKSRKNLMKVDISTNDNASDELGTSTNFLF